MKITKAMGRAAMKSLSSVGSSCSASRLALDALDAIGCSDEAWLSEYYESGIYEQRDDYSGHFLTALAMCAAIAGVKPEDVE